VVSLDREAPRHPDHGPLWRNVDLLDGDELARQIEEFNPEIVFHLAARTDLDESVGPKGYAANDVGVENLLGALRGLGSLQRVVVTSTQLVCRPGYTPASDTDYAPHTEYGRSKVRTEQITRAWNDPPCPWTLVRPTSIWGPWFRQPYRDFFMTVARNRFVNATGVSPLRSFGFVGNVVRQYVRIAEAPAEAIDRKTLYLADHDVTELRHWADLVQRELGVRPIRDVPKPLLATAARAGDLLAALGWRSVPLTTFRLRNMLGDNVVDMQPTRSVVGTVPFGLEEGVRVTVAWMRSEGLV
jgi:nucleoside-diphosphate-sugar epimerase